MDGNWGYYWYYCRGVFMKSFPSDLKKLKGLGDLEDLDELSKEMILLYMYMEENLGMKSRIKNPEALASLKTFGKFIKKKKLSESANSIKIFIKILLIFNVSKDGMGRTELFKTLSSLFDKETIKMSISERLTTNLNK